STGHTSDAEIKVRGQANLIGDAQVNIKATHEAVTSMAKSDATSNGLGASTNSYANNTFDVQTRVLTESLSTISTRALTVEANATPSVSGFTDPTSHGALIDTGDEHPSETVSYPRTIDFNSNVTLFSAPSPELFVDVNGVATIHGSMPT